MFTVVVATILLFVLYDFLSQVRKPKNFPPGPPWLPIVGNQLHLKNLSKSLKGLHLALSYLSQKYKTPIVGLKLGNELVATVFDYPLIKEVLTKEEFEGRPDNFFFKMRTFGRQKSGITGSDGLVWSTNRHFVVRHLKNLGFGKKAMEEMVKEEVDDVVAFLERDGKSVNVSHFFATRVLNILWLLVTSEKITSNGFLEELLDLFTRRGKAFDITGGILNIYPWIRYFAPKWSGFTLIQEINSKLRRIVDEQVRKHYESWEEDKEDDLMYCYISEIKKATNSVFSDEELIVVCFDFFIAGAQTTSGTLDLLFSMMIQRPEIQKKVQEEIDNNIDKDAVLEYKDINRLPYTSAVLMEIQRYLPILPIIGPRRATRDTHLGGYSIPKDTTILISLHGLYTNENYWKEPENFKPERFLNKNGELLAPENYVPFGLGRRRCLGEVLAKQCLFFFFVETLRKFSVTQASGSNGKLTAGITLHKDYKARFTRR